MVPFYVFIVKNISEDIQKDLTLSKVAVRFGTCAVRQVWLHTKHCLSILKTCTAVCQTSTRCEKSTQRCFWGLWDTRLSCVYCKSNWKGYYPSLSLTLHHTLFSTAQILRVDGKPHYVITVAPSTTGHTVELCVQQTEDVEREGWTDELSTDTEMWMLK